MKTKSLRKTIVAVLIAVLAVGLLAFGAVSSDAKTKTTKAKTNNRVVILYFSGSGNTKAVAQKIRKSTNGKLIRIQAKDPYTEADLDYSNNSSRVVKEHQTNTGDSPLTSTLRPEIRNQKAIQKAVKKAKVVYIGYPIWWQQAPHILYTLVENTNLKGKTVIPFNTSMASGNGSSSANLRKAAAAKNRINGKTKWQSGKGFDEEPSQKTVSAWVQKMKARY